MCEWVDECGWLGVGVSKGVCGGVCGCGVGSVSMDVCGLGVGVSIGVCRGVR